MRIEKRYNSIDEIGLPLTPSSPVSEGGYQASLDNRIEKLVKVFNALGYPTFGSCEGHLDPPEAEFIRHPYPWVTFNNYYDSYHRELIDLLGKYNLTAEVPWILCAGLRTQSEATTAEELLKLQQSADKLAQNLFDNFLFAGLKAEDHR